MTALALGRPSRRTAARISVPQVPVRDSDWFTSLYQRTFDSAYRFALMLTHDHDIAEDVVADAYARIWRRRHECQARSELAWVLSITRNRAIDEFRSRRVTVALDAIAEPEDEPGEPDTGLPTELREALKHCIGRLTDEQQQVIFLRFYEGLPHEAIGQRLHKNPNAVRAIQFRALTRLRKLLEEAHVRS